MVKKAQKWGKQGLKREAWPTVLSAPERSKRPRTGVESGLGSLEAPGNCQGSRSLQKREELDPGHRREEE